MRVQWRWNWTWKKGFALGLVALWALACSGGWSGDDEGGGGWDSLTGTNDDGGGIDPGDDDDDDDSDEEDPFEELCEDVLPFPTLLTLTSDDSNSQAAPVIARELVMEGVEIWSGMRVWEFLNYYEFGYEPPEPGTLGIQPQLVINDDGSYTLLTAVVAPSTADFGRRPRSLTYSVDTSGSMSGTPLEIAKETIRQSAANLHVGDIVSILSWDTEVTTILAPHVVSGADDPVLLAAIDDMSPGGATDLHGGLVAAYAAAELAYSDDRMNRVILISDGGANTGVTDEQIIAEHAEDGEAEGIYLSGVGMSFWGGGYVDVLMNQVTDQGKGAYIYLDSEAEAVKMFGDDDRFMGAMEVAARDVQLQVELPAGYMMAEFFGEATEANSKEVEVQHMAPGEEMLFHQTLVDCGGFVDGDDPIEFTVTWVDPVDRQERSESLFMTLDELAEAAGPQVTKADAIVTYAHALEDVWTVDPYLQWDYIQDAIDEVGEAADLLGDPELAAIVPVLAYYQTHFTDQSDLVVQKAKYMQQQWEDHCEDNGDVEGGLDEQPPRAAPHFGDRQADQGRPLGSTRR